MMIWRFRRLIATYGGDPRRWPVSQRESAESLLRRSEKARAFLAEARRFDELLAANQPASADDAMVSRIVARATALPQEAAAADRVALGWSIPRLWPQAACLAAAGVAGFIVGWANLLPGDFDGSIALDVIDYVDVGADGEEPIL